MNQSLFTSVARIVGCAARTFAPATRRSPCWCAERTLPFCAGFTLLEMVLVLFLVGLMASAAMMLTEGVEDQAKYDETKRRMELIRKAIVGDPTRTVNGGPEISGFVADMGRLPDCLRELLEAKDCTESENPLTLWSIDANTGIASGWRGPYLQVLPERDGALRFRDGYGNSDADDALNSGWNWQVYDAADNPIALADFYASPEDGVGLRVQSVGLKSNDDGDNYPVGALDGAPANRPVPLIVKDDWKIQLTVNATFKNQSEGNLPTVDENLVLRVYSRNSTDYVDYGDDANNFLTLVGGSVAANGANSPALIFSTASAIPMGSRAYTIVCHDASEPDSDNFVLFDGDCDSANGAPDRSNMRAFSAVPRQTLNLNLDWIIP